MSKDLIRALICLFIIALASSSMARMTLFIVSGDGGAAVIALDSSSAYAGATSWGSTISWSHTVGSGNNPVLFVAVGAPNSAVTWSSCVWDDGGQNEAMTGLTAVAQSNMNLRIFYKNDPYVTTGTILCTASGSDNLMGMAISLHNAQYGSNEDTKSAATGTDITHSFTTGTNGDWVINAGFHHANEAKAPNCGESEVQDENSSSGPSGLALSYETIASAGANDFCWTWTTSSANLMALAEATTE